MVIQVDLLDLGKEHEEDNKLDCKYQIGEENNYL